ncbi:acyltransferase [Pullulanibacillus sp. KACC 23026]|uniref:acyltransferase family protein n=1 Tax=Pullulanibacillus sp. KACC 23026 TaxID=3028315 RepID=UPI0023B0972D|nr:acyltransferase [Pullulanibacillus sp. KACC 23026]WEG11496.1 acyltransferase [Pullulanibacillus sp. KACC 23026]
MFLVVWYHAAPSAANVIGINRIYSHDFIPLVPRFAVSFFFVVSGFLFGRKVINIKDISSYTRKYLLKLIKLFVSWYIFYFAYDVINCIIQARSAGQDVTKQIMIYVYSQLKLIPIYYGDAQTSYQLWYLTALIWSVVILVIFIRLKKVTFLLTFSLLLNFIGLFGQTYSGLFHLPLQTRDALFYGLFYTTMGYYMAIHYKSMLKLLERFKLSDLFLLFLVVSFLAVIEEVVTIGFLNGDTEGENYLISTIPLTIILFGITIKKQNFGEKSFFTKIGKNSVGIYVSHTFFVSLLASTIKLIGYSPTQHYLFYHLISSLGIFVVSYYFYSFLQVVKKKFSFYLKPDKIVIKKETEWV